MPSKTRGLHSLNPKYEIPKSHIIGNNLPEILELKNGKTLYCPLEYKKPL